MLLANVVLRVIGCSLTEQQEALPMELQRQGTHQSQVMLQFQGNHSNRARTREGQVQAVRPGALVVSRLAEN